MWKWGHTIAPSKQTIKRPNSHCSIRTDQSPYTSEISTQQTRIWQYVSGIENNQALYTLFKRTNDGITILELVCLQNLHIIFSYNGTRHSSFYSFFINRFECMYSLTSAHLTGLIELEVLDILYTYNLTCFRFYSSSDIAMEWYTHLFVLVQDT